MNDPLAIAGLVVIFLAAGLLVITSRRRRPLRQLPALNRLLSEVYAGIERGRRLHVSLGNAGIHQPNSAAALSGLAAFRRNVELGGAGDLTPMATSGEGTLAVLSKASMWSGQPPSAPITPADTDRAVLTGPTPFSYTAGLLPVLQDEEISTSLFAGSFGPEIALATQAAEQQDQYMVGGSEALPAQAVFYVSASEALIGEEVFAAPAYLKAGSIYEASLFTQDILRWILIGGLVIGAVLSAVGLI